MAQPQQIGPCGDGRTLLYLGWPLSSIGTGLQGRGIQSVRRAIMEEPGCAHATQPAAGTGPSLPSSSGCSVHVMGVCGFTHGFSGCLCLLRPQTGPSLSALSPVLCCSRPASQPATQSLCLCTLGRMQSWVYVEVPRLGTQLMGGMLTSLLSLFTHYLEC